MDGVAGGHSIPSPGMCENDSDDTDTTKMYFLALCVNTGVWIGKVIYDVHKHIVVLNPFTPKLKKSPKNVKMYK